MYHSEKTAVGRYLKTGSLCHRQALRDYLASINKQKAMNITHELFADRFYAKHNKLTPSHLKRLDKLYSGIEKAIEEGRFAPLRTAKGHPVELFSLPNMETFWVMFKGFKVVHQNAYMAAVKCTNTFRVGIYVEGDVKQIFCPNEFAANCELNEHYWNYVIDQA